MAASPHQVGMGFGGNGLHRRGEGLVSFPITTSRLKPGRRLQSSARPLGASDIP